MFPGHTWNRCIHVSTCTRFWNHTCRERIWILGGCSYRQLALKTVEGNIAEISWTHSLSPPLPPSINEDISKVYNKWSGSNDVSSLERDFCERLWCSLIMGFFLVCLVCCLSLFCYGLFFWIFFIFLFLLFIYFCCWFFLFFFLFGHSLLLLFVNFFVCDFPRSFPFACVRCTLAWICENGGVGVWYRCWYDLPTCASVSWVKEGEGVKS